MEPLYKKNTRHWLNPEDESMSSSISSHIEVWKNTSGYVDATVEIRDCNRIITLEFDVLADIKDVTNQENLETTLRKFDLILGVFSDLRAKVLEAYPIALEEGIRSCESETSVTLASELIGKMK